MSPEVSGTDQPMFIEVHEDGRPLRRSSAAGSPVPNIHPWPEAVVGPPQAPTAEGYSSRSEVNEATYSQGGSFELLSETYSHDECSESDRLASAAPAAGSRVAVAPDALPPGRPLTHLDPDQSSSSASGEFVKIKSRKQEPLSEASDSDEEQYEPLSDTLPYSDLDYYGAGPSPVKTYDAISIATYPVPSNDYYPDKARKAMDHVILAAANLSRSNPRSQADAEAKKALLVGLHPDSQIYDSMPSVSRDPWNIAIWAARVGILKAADCQFTLRSCSMDITKALHTLPPLINIAEHSEWLGIDDFLRGSLKGIRVTHIVNPCTPVPCFGYYRFVSARVASLWEAMAGKVALDSILWRAVGPFGQKTAELSKMPFPHILAWQECLIKSLTVAFNLERTRIARQQTQEEIWSAGLTKKPDKIGIGAPTTRSKVASAFDSRRQLECPSCHSPFVPKCKVPDKTNTYRCINRPRCTYEGPPAPLPPVKSEADLVALEDGMVEARHEGGVLRTWKMMHGSWTLVGAPGQDEESRVQKETVLFSRYGRNLDDYAVTLRASSVQQKLGRQALARSLQALASKLSEDASSSDIKDGIEQALSAGVAAMPIGKVDRSVIQALSSSGLLGDVEISPGDASGPRAPRSHGNQITHKAFNPKAMEEEIA